MATLSEIRSKVRQRADIQAETARYPDSELNGYINDSYKELYGLLTRHSLIRDEASQTISADGSATYALPSDHFATLAVFREEDEYYRRLRHHSHRKRPIGGSASVEGEAGTYRIARVSGSKVIEMFPKPNDGTYIHTYVPVPTDFSSDSDSFDSILGWDEYVVIDAAIKCLRKEESPTGMLEQDKQLILARIQEEAEMQEMSEAHVVENTRMRYRHYSDRIVHDSANFRWYRNGDDY